MTKSFPRGEQGNADWDTLVQKIKKKGKGKKYDCIVGVSGGTDSCYLLHLTSEYGLRPLAVHLDNGWNTNISVKNIKKVISRLNIDLETYVINYEEIKDIMKSYMQAALPWIDFPTDMAIQASLYETAQREGVKYILNGYDFRSEGKQPTEWTYSDGKQLQYIQKKFGGLKLNSFPYFNFTKLFYWGFIKNIKMIRPYNFLEYHKSAAREFLKTKYAWQDYGGHHHENAFTKFAIAYWLPKKFNIDKRKITYSAQIMSGEISRNEALELLSKPPYDIDQMESDKDYAIKKLDLTDKEFEAIWNTPNKTFADYPSYYPLLKKFLRVIKPVFTFIFPWKPAIFYEMEVREQKVSKLKV